MPFDNCDLNSERPLRLHELAISERLKLGCSWSSILGCGDTTGHHLYRNAYFFQEITSFSPSFGVGLPPSVVAALLAQATAQSSSYSFDYGDSDIFEPTYTISSVLEVPKVLQSIALCL